MNPPRQDADDELRRAFSKALEDMRALANRLVDTTATEDQAWFRNLLIGIINCALYDHKNVEIGLVKYVPLAAWGTRNLLELKIVTKYVLESGRNANDFKIDLVIDIKEFYEQMTRNTVVTHQRFVSMVQQAAEHEQGSVKEAFLSLAEKEAAKPPETKITEEEVDTYKQLMAEFGIKETTKPKQHSELARRVAESEDFSPLNKICSKILHRTAFSIASTTVKGSLDEIIPFLSSRAHTDIVWKPHRTRSDLNFLRSSNPAGVTRTHDRPFLFSMQTNP